MEGLAIRRGNFANTLDRTDQVLHKVAVVKGTEGSDILQVAYRKAAAVDSRLACWGLDNHLADADIRSSSSQGVEDCGCSQSRGSEEGGWVFLAVGSRIDRKHLGFHLNLPLRPSLGFEFRTRLSLLFYRGRQRSHDHGGLYCLQELCGCGHL